MGQKGQAIREVATAAQLCATGPPRLLATHSAQLHTLLGLYAMSMNSMEAAEAQLNMALRVDNSTTGFFDTGQIWLVHFLNLNRVRRTENCGHSRTLIWRSSTWGWSVKSILTNWLKTSTLKRYRRTRTVWELLPFTSKASSVSSRPVTTKPSKSIVTSAHRILRLTNLSFVTLQTLFARDAQDGQCRGSEPFDVLFSRSARSHLPVAGQQPWSDEHGHSSHATRLQDPRCSHSTLGLCHFERQVFFSVFLSFCWSLE